MVTVSVVLPEVPVTLILYWPGAVVVATLIVASELPAPVIEVGLRVTVTPLGWPDTAKLIVDLKPLITVLVIVLLPEPPCGRVRGKFEAVRPKPGREMVLSRAVIKPLPLGLPQPVAKS